MDDLIGNADKTGPLGPILKVLDNLTLLDLDFLELAPGGSIESESTNRAKN
jgi:hypothetical protein